MADEAVGQVLFSARELRMISPDEDYQSETVAARIAERLREAGYVCTVLQIQSSGSTVRSEPK
jgi:hypothetical protein